ncbi:putative pre-mRNA-splicing factor ATP-dependent RNA helicase DHX16 [Durio zibethinus]|uniref:Pre-mRNA-splicing factor ATP-dependent RNA helicase DHX16 n=1 Tax=Durio zibethinus TaxID=66656 RepID=A0A6P5YKX1_DURZI|nr:putative pre-mRNA-splicing factor ATP-dependent RNA helicase DHX16 [Durio zibethinus]
MESTAINCDDEEKWEAEEEEALSLCDLPVNLIKEENQVQPRNEEDGESQAIKAEEDFNFGSWGGSLSTEPEMCAADEVFFKGQILPLRFSVSSDSGLTGCRQDSQNTSRCLSRSESMDHGSLSRFTSVSSSSTRSSHYSISSSNSITVTARNFSSITNSSSSSSSNSKSKPIKIRNNFNTHPSPKPQIRLSKTRPVNFNSRNQKSSMWDFFRLGLVRAPELELNDLKVRSNNNNANRNSVSRNSSCNSSNSSSSTTKNSSKKIVNNSGDQVAKNQQDSNKGFLQKRIGLFSGCKCSVNAVETVPLNNIVIIKSNKNSENEKAKSYAALEEKKKLLQELMMKKKMKEKEKEKQEGKQALSRHRTFEWLKELSHASYVDEA